MALLGNAAMLLWYDIVPEQVVEHDRWHTREHFPERVAIPGFLRAQRWVSRSPGPHYFVVYEVAGIDVLSSPAYNERLNHPTAWTAAMMPHFRGMVRGFCQLESSHGSVLGATGLVIRYAPTSGRDGDLDGWLRHALALERLQCWAVCSVHRLRSGRVPEMTAEQRLRGRDAGVDRVLLLTGYDADAMDALATDELAPAALQAQGAASGVASSRLGLACLSMPSSSTKSARHASEVIE